MKQCDSVQMRKNLELVDEMARAGLDFFPVPVVSEEHRKQLARLGERHNERVIGNCG